MNNPSKSKKKRIWIVLIGLTIICVAIPCIYIVLINLDIPGYSTHIEPKRARTILYYFQEAGIEITDVRIGEQHFGSPIPNTYEEYLEFTLPETDPNGGDLFVCDTKKDCDKIYAYYSSMEGMGGPYYYQSPYGTVVLRLTKGLSQSTALMFENVINSLTTEESLLFTTATPTIPTPSQTPEFTKTITPTSSATPTQTLDPLITPPTSTGTPTSTSTPTITPTSTQTCTPTVTPTRIPDNAGISLWMIYDGVYVGVRDIDWNYYLGYYRAETGKIYVSLYIVVINMSDSETTVFESDLSLIDGGGEITGGVIFGHIEPEFSTCTLRPRGSCEGWWTTMIWDRPEVKDNLTFRWDPCLFICDPLEVYINQ